MSVARLQVDESRSGWRAILPARWLPIWAYVAVLLGLVKALYDALHDPLGEINEWCFLAYDHAFMVPVALIAMIRMRIRYRIASLIAVQTARLLLEQLLVTLNPLSDAAFVCSIRDQLALDALYLAFVAAVAHVVTSLSGVFVSARAENDPSQAKAVQSHIAQWVYFIALLSFLCQPLALESQGGLRPQPEWRRIGIPYLPLVFCFPHLQLAITFTGVVVLSSLRNWKLALIMLGCLLMIAFASTTYDDQWNDPHGPVAALFSSLLVAISSAPFWLLVRWAGYRLRWDSMAN